ncbi:MAG: TlpA family protein disulfide reductase, partial [Dongiaceae bacterium]
ILAALHLRSGNPQPAADAGPPLAGTVADFTVSMPPRPAPASAFQDAQGREIRLADFAGRVVLVNLWATRCAPCVDELPALDRLQAELGGDDFMVLALSLDHLGSEVVPPFLAKLGIEHPGIYLDPQRAIGRELGVEGLPTTLLLDRQGRIVGMLLGAAAWDAPEAKALIRHYISAPAGAMLG